MDNGHHKLIAYRTGSVPTMRLAAAPVNREWMDETDRRFANRCLPILIANQAGWVVLNSGAFRAMWLGQTDLNGVVVEPADGELCAASSHFGYGILTFALPFLFRTPPGISLLIRGPANAPKDAIYPLEGLVETDWAVATATMNWRFTRAHTWVEFAVDEPICMVVPQHIDLLEEMQPRLMDITEDPLTHREFKSWSASRRTFNEGLRNGDSDAVKASWQRHYFHGISPSHGTETVANHRTKLKLREFERPPDTGRKVSSSLDTKMRIGGAQNCDAGKEFEIGGKGAQSDAAEQKRPRLRDIDLPTAEQLLNDLIIVEDFIPDDQCRVLIDAHRHWSKTEDGDHGLPIQHLTETASSAVELAQSIIARVLELIEAHFHETVWCDLSLLTAITGTFRHTLHADNARIFCPRHGTNAEELLRASCQCEDIEVQPNHTSWRRYTALLYLDDHHEGGDIIFGEAPNVYGKLFRREITVRRGLLVLSPSNELYHHRTTVVTKGIRYSMNSWFTTDKRRASKLFSTGVLVDQ